MKQNAANHKVFREEPQRRWMANASKTTQAECKQISKQALWNERDLAFVEGEIWFGLLGKNTESLGFKWEEVESPRLSGQYPILHRTRFRGSFVPNTGPLSKPKIISGGIHSSGKPLKSAFELCWKFKNAEKRVAFYDPVGN